MTGYHKYLTNEGYLVKKSEVSAETLQKIRKEDLHFKAVIPKAMQSIVKTNAFCTYRESPNYLYLPKFYAAEKLGAPLKTKISDGENMSFESELYPNYSIKEYQRPIYEKTLNQLRTHGGGILSLFCGWGKCLAKGSQILMHDLTTKAVENLIIGDKLIGDDTNIRLVTSVSRGQESMYMVCPSNLRFDSYVCNRSHIIPVFYPHSTCGNYLPVAHSSDIWYEYHMTINDLLFQSSTELSKMRIFKAGYKQQLQLLSPHTYAEELVRLDNLGLIVDQNRCRLIAKSHRNIQSLFLWAINLQFKYLNQHKFKTSELNEILDQIKASCADYYDSADIETSSFEVKKITDCGDYYGFTIDGPNGKFLMHDFTVNHNTFLAIAVSLELRTKTLVVVHKDDLIDQWTEEILKFTGNKARVGCIQRDRIDVHDKDFVIAMLQSMSKKEYGPEIFKSFGLTIVDECHHVGSEVFSQTLTKFTTKYTLGLSATPNRSDMLTTVFTNYLGPIFHVEKRANRDDTLVIRFHCQSNAAAYEEQYFQNGTRNTAKMTLDLIKLEVRNELLVNIIKAVYAPDFTARAGKRKSLVLSSTRAHLENIRDLLADFLDQNEITCGFYWGCPSGSSKKQHKTVLDSTKECDIILGTFHIASEALNIPGLDTLLAATSQSKAGIVEQTVGRILRRQKTDTTDANSTSLNPVVIDVIDYCGNFIRHAQSRLKTYRSEGFKVVNLPKINLDNLDTKWIERFHNYLENKNVEEHEPDGETIMINDDDDDVDKKPKVWQGDVAPSP